MTPERVQFQHPIWRVTNSGIAQGNRHLGLEADISWKRKRRDGSWVQPVHYCRLHRTWGVQSRCTGAWISEIKNATRKPRRIYTGRFDNSTIRRSMMMWRLTRSGSGTSALVCQAQCQSVSRSSVCRLRFSWSWSFRFPGTNFPFNLILLVETSSFFDSWPLFGLPQVFSGLLVGLSVRFFFFLFSCFGPLHFAMCWIGPSHLYHADR